MEKIFLTYVNISECDSYTLTGKVNDEFVDIDASKRFVHIPLSVNTSGVSNYINLKVNSIEQNDSFHCMPFLLWQSPFVETDPNQNFMKYRYHLFLPDMYNFFVQQSIDWLGTQSSIDTEIKIQKKLCPPDEPYLIINNNCHINRMRVAMKNFSYVPNSWFVCYKFYPKKWKDNKYKNYGPQKNIGIRVEKNLEISKISSITKFNYLKIGEKTIALDKVLYFAKINSIYDYMRNLKICERILSVHYQVEYNIT